MRSYLGLGVLAAGVGAGMMFLLDPQTGRRRRAILRDKTLHYGRQASVAVEKTTRDVKNRAHGTVVSIKSGHIVRMRPAILNANWPPAIRLMVGTAGGAMTVAGLAKRGAVGSVLSTIGLGSLILAITNLSIRRAFNRASTTPEKRTPARQTTPASGGYQAHTEQRSAA
jgi:hypothetical protein